MTNERADVPDEWVEIVARALCASDGVPIESVMLGYGADARAAVHALSPLLAARDARVRDETLREVADAIETNRALNYSEPHHDGLVRAAWIVTALRGEEAGQ